MPKNKKKGKRQGRRQKKELDLLERRGLSAALQQAALRSAGVAQNFELILQDCVGAGGPEKALSWCKEAAALKPVSKDRADLKKQILRRLTFAFDPDRPDDSIFGALVEKNAETAFAYCKEAAALGGISCTHDLAVMYREGQGTEKDPAQAFKYFKMASDDGFLFSLIDLGLAYQHGSGCDRDLQQAAVCFVSAYERLQQPAAALYLAALLQQYPMLRAYSPHEAKNLYRFAAQQGFPDAAYNLAVLLFARGHGDKRERAEAIGLWQQAAKGGLAIAQLMLACLAGRPFNEEEKKILSTIIRDETSHQFIYQFAPELPFFALQEFKEFHGITEIDLELSLRAAFATEGAQIKDLMRLADQKKRSFLRDMIAKLLKSPSSSQKSEIVLFQHLGKALQMLGYDRTLYREQSKAMLAHVALLQQFIEMGQYSPEEFSTALEALSKLRFRADEPDVKVCFLSMLGQVSDVIEDDRCTAEHVSTMLRAIARLGAPLFARDAVTALLAHCEKRIAAYSPRALSAVLYACMLFDQAGIEVRLLSLSLMQDIVGRKDLGKCQVSNLFTVAHYFQAQYSGIYAQSPELTDFLRNTKKTTGSKGRMSYFQRCVTWCVQSLGHQCEVEHPMLGREADVYLPALNVVIEAHGPHHYAHSFRGREDPGDTLEDQARTALLEKKSPVLIISIYDWETLEGDPEREREFVQEKLAALLKERGESEEKDAEPGPSVLSAPEQAAPIAQPFQAIGQSAAAASGLFRQ